jgi:hypothetical protein
MNLMCDFFIPTSTFEVPMSADSASVDYECPSNWPAPYIRTIRVLLEGPEEGSHRMDFWNPRMWDHESLFLF